MIESTPTEESTAPALHVDRAQVCVMDGIWQDQPDQLAAFDEARLNASTPGRGNLYILLDVSGPVDGRAEVEHELIETVRREYGSHRGSVTFALSEALRAANTALFQLNLSVGREFRRMAGLSAAVLRGHDLYIAQAGPVVVYVEAAEVLRRYPAESDWFKEDQPLINPQGNASPPLGIRREFACDLFHTPVAAGDVLVLATRGLTQLATTEELAQAFKDRGAEDIADFLEDAANGSDLSAIIAELVDPRDLQIQEPRAPEPAQPALIVATQPAAPVVEPEEEEELIPWPKLTEEAAPLPLAAEATAVLVEPARPPAETSIPVVKEGEPTVDETELDRRRLEERHQERRRQRGTQFVGLGRAAGGLGRVAGGVGAALVGMMAFIGATIGAGLTRAVQVIDWKRGNAWFNRTLNSFFFASWRLLALFVRLILPGAVPKTSLMPRRASKEPVWLRVVALLLALFFILLALSAYLQQDGKRVNDAAQQVQQARNLLNQAQTKKESDKTGARTQLQQALALLDQAQALNDTQNAHDARFEIQDQLNEVSDVEVLYHLLPIAPTPADPSELVQVVADDNDIYFLDRGAGRIYHYTVNESATQSTPAPNGGVILKVGDKVGTATVDRIREITWAPAGGNTKAGLIAVTGSALWQYDPGAGEWQPPTSVNTAGWGEIQSAASYNGNLYLLDAAKNQLWKYTPLANGGFNPQAVPYLPANSTTDLSRAVDLAIDGDVWALGSNGTVLRLRAAQRLPFELNGLDVPLKNPVAIFAPGEADALYIADAGNQRIVEFDKTGRYARQFKPMSKNGAAFDSLRALYASESKRKFYFVSSTGVYLANIP